MIIFNGGEAYPTKKIALRPDGLHALPYRAVPFGAQQYVALALWTKDGADLRQPKFNLPGMQTACAELTDTDTVIVSSPNSNGYGGSPIFLTEFGLTGDPLTQVQQTSIGDNTSWWGASCKTSSGGCFFAHFRKFVAGQTPIDICYRPPKLPTVPGQPAPPLWVKKSFTVTFSLEVAQGIAFCAMVEGPDGLIWLFWTCDSSATVACARFRITGFDVTLASFDPSFIHGDVPYAINGELPDVVAITDKFNKRILLGYQSFDWMGCNCPQQLQSKSHTICAAYPDGKKELVTKLPWTTSHIMFPLTVPFPRREAIYFTAQYFDIATCTAYLRTGIFDGRFVQIAATTPNEHQRAYSDDGWNFLESKVDDFHKNYALLKHKFRPELKIAKVNNTTKADQIRITWDEPSANDQLQSSPDMKTWTNIAGATTSPVIVPSIKPHEYFRLVQHFATV